MLEVLRAPEGEQGAGDVPAGDAPPAGEPAVVGEGAGAVPAPSGEAPDFSFVPEEYRADGKLNADGFKTHYETQAAELAALKDRQAGVPESAEGYEFSLPEGITFADMGLPEDYAFELNTEDPAFAPLYQEFGAALHKHGVPKDAAPEILGLMAKYQAVGDAQMYAQQKSEMTALGPTAKARIGEVSRLLQARLPADLAQPLLDSVSTASGVKALERLLSGSGSFAQSQGGAGLPDDAKPMDRLRAANAQSMNKK